MTAHAAGQTHAADPIRLMDLLRDAPRVSVIALGLSLLRAATAAGLAWGLGRQLNATPLTTDALASGVWVIGAIGLPVGYALLALVAHPLVVAQVKRHTSMRRRMLVNQLYPARPYPRPATPIDRLHTALVQDAEQIDHMYVTLLSQVMPAVMLIAGLAIWLAISHGWVLLTGLLVVGPAGVVQQHLQRRLRIRFQQFRSAYDHLSVRVHDAMTIQELTRDQSAEASERTLLGQAIDEVTQSGARLSWANGWYSVGHSAATSLLVTLVLTGAAWSVQAGQVTTGDVASLSLVLMLLMQQAGVLRSATPIVLAGFSALEALHRHWPAAITPDVARLPLPDTVQGHVAIEHVHWGTPDRIILRDVSLVCPAGSITAIIGPNGSGKSTLLNLIQGNLAPATGRLLFDGVDYRQLDLDALANRFGIVRQSLQFRPGTVFENLAYGLPDVTIDQLLPFCSMTGADRVIAALPGGFEARLGHTDVSLSGGELQRLALTRALVRRPRVLLLDEPTSHLDRDSAYATAQLLQHLPDRPTILVATHDDLVVDVADQSFSLPACRLSVKTHDLMPVARP